MTDLKARLEDIQAIIESSSAGLGPHAERCLVTVMSIIALCKALFEVSDDRLTEGGKNALRIAFSLSMARLSDVCQELINFDIKDEETREKRNNEFHTLIKHLIDKAEI